MIAAVAHAIHTYGESVSFRPVVGLPSTLVMSVQSEMTEALYQDFDLLKYVVYAVPADFTSVPKKFDRMTIRGRTVALDEDASIEFFEGLPVAYVMRIKG